MDELFQQLAFINAILGGFAITFLSVLVTAETDKKISNWVVAILFLAVSCFIISAIGSTFSSVIASRTTSGDIPASVNSLHVPISILFMGGILLLFISLGLTGWLRSRNFGKVTFTIAIVSIFGCFFVLRPFMY